MKKVSKSIVPKELTDFNSNHAGASWDDFRHSPSYAEVKKLIFQDQWFLCAFCEIELPSDQPHKQRIEHFHSKSDGDEWLFDWQNLLGVCKGGSDANRQLHPTPENLSCDAYKDHLITTNKLLKPCEGLILNPLSAPAFPCLFELNKRTGELKANIENCAQVMVAENQYLSTSELVDKTITHLNLNCDRLNQQRLAVLKQYNQQIKKARERNDKNYRPALATRWFQHKCLSFFTTRRILLGQHAEACLQNLAYNG